MYLEHSTCQCFAFVTKQCMSGAAKDSRPLESRVLYRGPNLDKANRLLMAIAFLRARCHRRVFGIICTYPPPPLWCPGHML